MRAKTYHWTVNGVPACSAKETAVPGFPHPCAQGSREEAQEAAHALLDLCPDAQVAIVEGACPRPDEPCCYGYEGCDVCCTRCDICQERVDRRSGLQRCEPCAERVSPVETAAFHEGFAWGALLTVALFSLAALGWHALVNGL
jgi:hypothetical protein